ncbi:MAG: L-arabinose isomerase, partial [Bacilli bacterium]
MNRKSLKEYEFWFLVGSQFLYGPETLDMVSQQSKIIASGIGGSTAIPCKVVYKATLKTPEEIEHWIKEANYNDTCAGIIVWMHTFSPSKMWINGLSLLQKPYCHLHTQFNRNIPDEGIDMDFMNLNQSAHGDREHGFIAARMHLRRKIVVGYWEDDDVQQKIGKWMRSAVGAIES